MTTIDETKLNAAAAEEAQVVNQNGNNSSSKKTPWREVTMGGVAGIVLGAASALGANALAQNAGNKDDLQEDVQDASQEDTQDATHPAAAASIPEIGDSVKVADGVNDDMSFSEAFAEARHEVGAGGVFVWHDQVYGTYYKTEWDAMSEDQKSDYWSAVHGTDEAHDFDNVDAADAADTMEPELVAAGTFADGSYVELYDTTGNGQGDVAVLDIDSDGQADIAAADVDDDGCTDILVADINGDGVVDQDECYLVTDEGVVTMDDVCAGSDGDLLEPTYDI